LLDEAIVPFQLSGIESSNLTRGHYIQFNRMIEIDSIESYGRILEKNGVIIDQKKRKDLIMKGLLRAASKLNGELVEDDELLETVTFLTESPHIVACEFDRDFLKIPDIVLITEMREHQKYFAVRDRSGNLLSRFLVVSNNPSTKHVKVGNERVISARFNDARFFFNEDRKIRLFDRVESLKSVLFHKDLGTIYDKVMRMMFIAEYVSAQLKLNREITEKVNRSILLSKADLNTSMVFEFTSLQGKIGRIYALLDGEDEDVADAIDSHYKPRFQGDTLPDNLVGIVVSISEKLDNIFGSFSVGNIPKGSQDPYALRRQANAIVEIAIRNKINIDFGEILTYISEKYNNGKDLVGRIIEFISARAKTIFLESGFKYDEIDACLSVGFYDFFELFRRAESINLFRKNENFIEMLLSFKRMNNILVAFRKDYPDYRLQFNPERLKEDAEKDLFLFFESKRGTIEEYIKTNRYQDLFHLLIDGKPVVDRFFDKVMVMAEDLGSRDNRLSLLENILYPFKNLLDFSRISE
jgi:glycyl-tRNA synthetase beta chain